MSLKRANAEALNSVSIHTEVRLTAACTEAAECTAIAASMVDVTVLSDEKKLCVQLTLNLQQGSIDTCRKLLDLESLYTIYCTLKKNYALHMIMMMGT